MRAVILEADAAWRFIEEYKQLLLEIDGDSGSANDEVVPRLHRARAKLLAQPMVIQEARERLLAKSKTIDPEILQAVHGLEVTDWVYLKDTKVHSIFMDTKTKRAFGVLGLTDPLHDLVGGSGVFLNAGLVRYRGRFVCDGLAVKSLWLGPNYKKSFNAAFAEWKAAGRFYVRCEA